MTEANGRSGILLIDKPAGITSHDVVARTRKRAGTRKVGHAGTLDPMATGLLVLGINNSTRLLTFLVGLDKEYFATIRLGSATNTDDAEGEPISAADHGVVASLDRAVIDTALARLRGEIRQIPSSVSAIRVGGKRAYTLARAGETVELAARTVTIGALEVLADRRGIDDTGRDIRDLDVRVECTSGTYIRAIARDLGASLGTGGHLTALRRSKIGPFSVADAAKLETLDVASALRSPGVIASRLFPVYSLSDTEAVDLGNGKRLSVDPVDSGDSGNSGNPGAPGLIAAIAPDGRLVGLLQISKGVATPTVNFARDRPTGQPEPEPESGESA